MKVHSFIVVFHKRMKNLRKKNGTFHENEVIIAV